MDALGHQVERLRTDSAAEFVWDKEFRQWLVSNCVMQEASAPYAKHQNGVVERHIQTIEDRMTALLIQAGLGMKYWGEAIQCAVATWNAMSGNGKSPLEVLTGLGIWKCSNHLDAEFISEPKDHCKVTWNREQNQVYF
jgi:hypothetical protein